MSPPTSRRDLPYRYRTSYITVYISREYELSGVNVKMSQVPDVNERSTRIPQRIGTVVLTRPELRNPRDILT